jgi:hypothetical protein
MSVPGTWLAGDSAICSISAKWFFGLRFSVKWPKWISG